MSDPSHALTSLRHRLGAGRRVRLDAFVGTGAPSPAPAVKGGCGALIKPRAAAGKLTNRRSPQALWRSLILGCLVSLIPLGITTATASAATPETPEKVQATGITATTALVSGVLNPKATGEAGVWFFVYGVTPPCGGELLAPGPPLFADAVGKKEEVVMEPLTGLQPHTQYEACLIERNKEQTEEATSAPVA